MKKLTLLFTILIAANFLVAESTVSDSLIINQWLTIDAITVTKPLFNTEENINGKAWQKSAYLSQRFIPIKNLMPSAKKTLKWNNDIKRQWTVINQAALSFSNNNPQKIAVSYAGFYIKSDEWQSVDLKFTTGQLLQIWLDGQQVKSKECDDSENITASLDLERGWHRIILKTVAPSADQWNLSGTVRNIDKKLTLSTTPKEFMTTDKVIYSEKVRDVEISYDGEYSAITLYQADKETKETHYWTEIRKSDNGDLVQSFKGGMKISALTWSPNKNEFIYKTSDNGKSTLWLANIERGSQKKILSDVTGFGGFQWSPSGEFLVYSQQVEATKDESGVRRLNHMPDRQPSNRKANYLYKLTIASGQVKQLTYGSLPTHLHDISEDGHKLIISRHHQFTTIRPYSKTDYFIYDLTTGSLDSLFSLKWANSLQWSPDGEKILITGGVSMFDGIGKNLDDDITPNDYDNQAFIYYINSKKVMPITKNFNPAINSAEWSKINNNIYIVASDRSWVSLFEYNVDKNRFSKKKTGLEAVQKFDLAAQETKGIYFGSSANEPFKVCSIELEDKGFLGLKKEDYKVIYTPAKKAYKHTELSDVKQWTFINKDGVEIEGRYYLPPDFEASKKYPCIVYYYGGTSPVSRTFDGRYPKNYWAANGYVVYVLQPSGATGFGQEFAAKHVNEWGSIVPDEIIMGVEKFVESHNFVDKNKLGCIGASYGGFTTESLITKTDLFAAAVSHAGISAVPSYWGEGYWGYSYGAVANANTFPWSHPDVFMKNSALYNADKIDTPLLMTHGTADNNVPPGESIQLYTALKLLGKDVELLQCKDQGHFVLEYGQREKWSKSIIAWFDKYLKGDADWWEDMYAN